MTGTHGGPAASVALGLALLDRGRLDDAVVCFERVVASTPENSAAWVNCGIALLELGRPAEAVIRFRRALLLAADHPGTHLNLGVALLRQGRAAEAVACFEQALVLEPGYAKAHLNLGTAMLELGRYADAAGCCGQALALAPDLTEAALNLGVALERQGRLDLAVPVWRRLVDCRPRCFEAHLNLGTALMELGRLVEAAESFTQALVLKPDSAESHMALGVLLRRQNRLAEAEDRFRRSLALSPDQAEGHLNLGAALQEQGRLEEAVACFERAQNLRPDWATAGAALVFTRLYQPGSELAGIAAAARDWANRYVTAYQPVSRVPTPEIRERASYRLGFVSGDFRTHAVGFLVLPALEGLARAGHRFYCYANQATDDALTDRIRRAAAVWRPVFGWSDAALAAQIQADDIDILVDLSGYTALNRLLVFARKPAPIQVAWIGYPATTGLDAMDYLLADWVQVPNGAERYYQERVIRLPDGYVVYQPPDDAEPVGPLPRLSNGFITFGSFNTLKKITAPVMAAWSRILDRVSGSRLLLKTSALDCRETRLRCLRSFTARGIAAERIGMEGGSSPSAHRQAIAGVDIALDPFPYNGGLTTLETLWLGVPVVTMAGETLCGRHSLGYLSVIGLQELAAGTVDEYVDKAAALASDEGRLMALRAALRPRLAASPLCDVDHFVGHLEQAFATVWAHYRAGRAPSTFHIGPP